jgi:putative nucleotidyltransferase with HDIG domain
MNPDDLRHFTPQPPEWKLDWDGMDETYGWIQRMRDCPQNPVFHAEGDVWIHTRMVIEELAKLPAWRGLFPAERELLFAAAALHDVGKPATTRVESGYITSRGHSIKGARMARRILWDMGVPPALREAIAALIRYHQLPYYLIERADARRMAIEISQTARVNLLTILAEADVRGRVCPDLTRLLDNIALFAELCREHNCWHGPRPFANDHSRFLYFRTPGRDPDYAAFDDTRSEITMMSGFPGAGKDTWLERNYRGPVVSLDGIREELGVLATGDQGSVVVVARERARDHFRAGEDFAWNATNVSRELRGQLIELAAAYDARVRIVWVEAPRTELWNRNRTRPKPLPEQVIDSMMERWETPDPCEAHRVERIW